MYNFEDKGEREVALRPEMTPSLARILAGRHRAMSKPIRWFSVPQLFRYERQQRGRLREHFQWNVDIVGEAGVNADVEVLAVGLDGLRELGLTHKDIVARVSDRQLMTEMLGVIGVPLDGVALVFAIIDKMDRAKPDHSLHRLCDEAKLDAESAEKVWKICHEKKLENLRKEFKNHKSVIERLENLDRYMETLRAMGLGPYVEFDAKIVRGLAYYTGIVFEIFDRDGALRAICGGGRYDRLLELVGGDSIPAVGFGMGDVVIGELLSMKNLNRTELDKVDIFIVILEEEQRSLALKIAHQKRAEGFRVLYSLKSDSLRKQLEMASKAGAHQAIILAPKELEQNLVLVKDLQSGTQQEVRLDEFV